MTTKRNSLLAILTLVFTVGLLVSARPAQACGSYEITPEMQVSRAVERHFWKNWRDEKRTNAFVVVQSVHIVGNVAVASIKIVIDKRETFETVILIDKDLAWTISSRIPALPSPSPAKHAKR